MLITHSIYLYKVTIEYTFFIYTRLPTVIEVKINDIFS